jgi:nucleoside phosphorylase
MGHLAAAVRTAQIIQQSAPRVILFVGTAASLKPERVQIGDVVIPKLAVSRYYDKVSERGQADYQARAAEAGFKEYLFGTDNALVADLRTSGPSDEALGMIAHLQIDKVRLDGGDSGEISLGGHAIKLRKPKVHDDVDILSCGMVVDSVSYRDFLSSIVRQNARKAHVIDMESYGFFNVLEALRRSGVGHPTHGIMIRGISDYAGRKQQSEQLPNGWKECSVRNAAAAAADLVFEIARED